MLTWLSVRIFPSVGVKITLTAINERTDKRENVNKPYELLVVSTITCYFVLI